MKKIVSKDGKRVVYFADSSLKKNAIVCKVCDTSCDPSFFGFSVTLESFGTPKKVKGVRPVTKIWICQACVDMIMHYAGPKM